ENPESSLGKGWESVLGIAFSRDGKMMASGGFTNDKGIYFARRWDGEIGNELRRFVHGKHRHGIPRLAVAPHTKRLSKSSHDARLGVGRTVVCGSLMWTPARNDNPSRGMAAGGGWVPWPSLRIAKRWPPPAIRSACTTRQPGRSDCGSTASRQPAFSSPMAGR